MPRRIPWHPRILPAPDSRLIFDARIDAIHDTPPDDPRDDPRDDPHDIVVDISALRMSGRPVPERIAGAEVDGDTWERVRGERVPYRLRFRGAQWMHRTGAFARLADLPPDADARRLFYLVHLREAHTGPRYVFVTDATDPGELVLRARGCELTPREGPRQPVEFLRRYAAPPPPPAVLVPRPASLHARYGGDPIRIRLGGRIFGHRLFIGGMHHQRSERPQVDHVVNLCGFDSPWALLAGRHLDDRFSPRTEMRQGMRAGDLLEEAGWVAEALRGGRSVLVHCAAGINRSSSVCCAALMLLEGLSAEQALARVRERHPEAHPDPYHWFALRHLRESTTPQRRARHRTCDVPRHTPQLARPVVAGRVGHL